MTDESADATGPDTADTAEPAHDEAAGADAPVEAAAELDIDATTPSDESGDVPPVTPGPPVPPWWRRRPSAETIALAALLLVVVVLARMLHRHGHSWGDDFALYTDQARSLYCGETRSVIEDNRFAVLNSATPTFSPYGYPWVWPILLSPFVAIFGFAWDTLKWVEVAVFVGVLVTFHRLVRRRTDAITAWGMVAVLGLSPSLLMHTDKLLSEFPHLLATLLALVFLDRFTRRHGGWHLATTGQLVALGLLVVVAFNVRREGLALLPAIAAAMVVGRCPWRQAVVPFLSFVVGAAVFQMLLPTALLPRYPGEGFHRAGDMLRGPLIDGVGLHLSVSSGWAAIVLLTALAAGCLRMIRHARTDIALLVLPLATLVPFARFPFNGDPRYYIQIVPFAVYFLAQLPATIAELLPGRPSASAVVRGLSGAILGVLLVLQVTHLPDPVREARDFAATGSVQFGPADPSVRAVLDAVAEVTPPRAVVAFMKARTMSLYTDRRSIQSSDLMVVLQRADYLAMLKGSDFSQPLVTEEDAAAYGMTNVWEDPRWIIWRIDRPTG